MKSVHKIITAILVFAMMVAMMPMGVLAAEEAAPVTSWDFSAEDFTGENGEYNGLKWTNGQKNKVYLLAKEGTLSVPVSGPCDIVVSACYQYSFYFESDAEASVGQKTGSTSQIDSFTYSYDGEAGYVDITVLGQSYLTKVEVKAKAEPVTEWDFSAEDFTGENGEYNTLKWTNGQKNKVYLLAKEGTLSVPVSGPCDIVVSACYQYSFYFESDAEASVGQKTGSTSQIDSFTYSYDGEAGYVDITVLGQSYLTKIEVKAKAEPVTQWVFNGDDFNNGDYANIGAGEYNTLKWTNCRAHNGTYLYAGAGTISVPVSGPSEIIVSGSYQYSFYFESENEPSVNQKTDTTSTIEDFTYHYMGEAGYVDVTVLGTSYITKIEVKAKDVSEVPQLDSTKIYVWDFAAEALSGEQYVNMLTADEINSWFADVEPGTSGKNIAAFTSSDGLLRFSDGGYPTTHRLRTTNEALTRWDNKSLTDADGNVYNGYIYSNKSQDASVYVAIKVNAGEKVTLVVGSNGGDSLINFESPSGVVTTGQFLSGGAKAQLLTFYPTETGEYKIYSTTEKLVLARIYREATNDITVSGTVTAPEGLADYSLIFTNTLSGATYTAEVKDGAYSLTLKDGYSYDLALGNANGYVIASDGLLTFEKGCGNTASNITVEAVDLVTVTGSITGVSEATLAKIGLQFVADAIYIPQVTVSGATYTAVLEKGMTYQLIVTGINDYNLTSATTVSYEADTTADITLEAKPTYAITIDPKGATAADLANATFIFTNLNEEGYVYTFTGTENIALRDGVYSVKVVGSGAFVQQLTSNLKVSGAAVTKTIKFSDDISAWDFSNAEFTGEGGSFQGLSWTNGQKNKVYLLAKDGTISVPVDGDCQVKVSVCYQYSFYFTSEDEASVGQKTGSTSQIDTFVYNYTGEKGTVNITVLGTTYITKIEVIKPVEYKETVTVGTSGCDYTTINAALDAVRAMARPNNERVTILIQPGNYEEMLVVDVPNVTLKNASENPSIELTNCGVDIHENAVRITWYYGHGYTYYSMGSDCKFDAEILEVNKENGYPSFENPGAGTTNGSYWNSTVVITASGFQAEGIIFENSFNQYISAAAANDILVKQGSAKEGSVARADMEVYSTLVQDKAYVERAGALAIADNCKEVYFENCKFIGRQDTLYGGKGAVAAFYDCAVYGSTDYIYGGMTAVFAKCDLVFNTSENKNDAGYITAAQQASGRGFLMYNCTITSTTPGVDTASQFPSKPGYFGRPWAAKTGEAVFYMTNIDATCENWYTISASLIRADGWLSTLSGESALCGEYGTYEKAAGVDNTANRVSWATNFENATLSDGTPITIEAFLGDWNAFEGKDLTIVMSTEQIDNSPKEEPEPTDPTEPTVPAEPVEHHFNSLTDVNIGSTTDKAEVAEGTTFADGFFTVIGKVTQRYQESKGGVYAIEIGKNMTGAIEFTLTGEGKVTIVVSSTGGSNTSAVAIVNVETGETVLSTEVSTTATTELSVQGLKPGTYRIVSPESDYNRGYRLMTIDVVETPADPGKTGDMTFVAMMLMVLSAAALVVLTKKKRFF